MHLFLQYNMDLLKMLLARGNLFIFCSLNHVHSVHMIKITLTYNVVAVVTQAQNPHVHF